MRANPPPGFPVLSRILRLFTLKTLYFTGQCTYVCVRVCIYFFSLQCRVNAKKNDLAFLQTCDSYSPTLVARRRSPRRTTGRTIARLSRPASRCDLSGMEFGNLRRRIDVRATWRSRCLQRGRRDNREPRRSHQSPGEIVSYTLNLPLTSSSAEFFLLLVPPQRNDIFHPTVQSPATVCVCATCAQVFSHRVRWPRRRIFCVKLISTRYARYDSSKLKQAPIRK